MDNLEQFELPKSEPTSDGFKFKINNCDVNVHIIGVTGAAGSGKDTLCTFFDHWLYFKDTGGYVKGNGTTHYYRREAFADALKRGCSEFFGIPLRHYYDPAHKEQVHPFWGTSPRQQAQLVGTEAMRNGYANDIWLKRVHWNIIQELDVNLPRSIAYWISHKTDDLRETRSFHVFFFISDVRFPNEADWIHSLGGFNIHIRSNRDPATEHMSHASENGVDIADHDIVIDNNALLTDFKTNCHALFERVFDI